MIKNIPKNKILAKNIKICGSVFSKTKGLMFSKKIYDKAFIFAFSKEKRWSVHMLFVFFPIDVLWLDKNNNIIDMAKNLKPFCPLCRPKKQAKYIIELPDNVINNSKTEIGDKVIW